MLRKYILIMFCLFKSKSGGFSLQHFYHTQNCSEKHWTSISYVMQDNFKCYFKYSLKILLLFPIKIGIFACYLSNHRKYIEDWNQWINLYQSVNWLLFYSVYAILHLRRRYILCFNTIISMSLDTCYLFYCDWSMPAGILFYYMTGLVI